MSRTLTAGVQALFDALHLPFMSITVEIPALDLYLTNLPRSITLDGQAYQGALDGTDQFTLTAKGLGENLRFEGQSATVEIGSLLGAQQARFIADDFRGKLVTVRIVYIDSGGVAQPTGWETTYRCDMDTANEDQVTLRLASSDSVTGEEYPRNTNQDYACTFILGRGRCPFRWHAGLPTALRTCDHGYDTPNGCKAHFPDVGDPKTGRFTVQPKPFGGRISSIDDQLILSNG